MGVAGHSFELQSAAATFCAVLNNLVAAGFACLKDISGAAREQLMHFS
jgi:hypothetical protein